MINGGSNFAIDARERESGEESWLGVSILKTPTLNYSG